MRIRTIKPEFWQHKMHKKISESAALVALATLSLADDEGRFEVEFDKIKALLFTFRTLAVPLEKAFEELKAENVRWLFTYPANVAGEDVQVAQITTFNQHQRINRPSKSLLPPPPQNHPWLNPHGTFTERSVTTHGTLTNDSRHDDMTTHGTFTDDSLGKGRKGKEGNGKEGGSMRAREVLSDSSESDAHIPTVEEVIDWGRGASAIPEDFCRHYHDAKETKRTWLNGRNELIHWRREIVTWWTKDRDTWASKNKKRAEKNSDTKAELDSILAELQWQKDPKRLAELKKRKKELEAGQ